jgi:hypothetical protein
VGAAGRETQRAAHETVRVLLPNGIKEATTMLWTLAVILVILWALGLVSSYTFGGFIHVLLALAAVAVVISLIRGRESHG